MRGLACGAGKDASECGQLNNVEATQVKHLFKLDCCGDFSAPVWTPDPYRDYDTGL